MREVIQLLHSPAFWVGTVLVGFLMNVLAHYFVVGLTRIGTATLRSTSEILRKPMPGRLERARRLQAWLDVHPEGASLALSRALSLEVMSLVWLLMCVGMFVCGLIAFADGSWVARILISIFGVFAGLIAIANLAVAREYESAVAKHSNGLATWPGV